MQTVVSLALIFVLAILQASTGLVITRKAVNRMPALHENFGLDIAESPEENTLREIYGEVNYKNFVGKYEPNGLLLGGYDIIQRIREQKLLTLTVESGLLEALEQKGVTLSQVEKALPLVDSLGLLPLLVKNKGLVLSIAPLVIENAPIALPLVVSLLKTSPTTFLAPGVALLGAGLFESTDNLLLGLPLVLLGLPLSVLGSVLGTSISLPDATSYTVSSSPVSSSSESISAPKVSARPSAGKKISAAEDFKPKAPRKLVKINPK